MKRDPGKGAKAPLPNAPIVLVVDDEPSICRALSIALSRCGYHALPVESGDQAERLLRERRVDAMLVDLRIPDVRGDVLFHTAVSLQPHLLHRTLFLTGDVTPRARALTDACGCPVIGKPFELSDVMGFVQRVAPLRESASA